MRSIPNAWKTSASNQQHGTGGLLKSIQDKGTSPMKIGLRFFSGVVMATGMFEVFPSSPACRRRIKTVVQVRLYNILQWRGIRSRVADTPNNGNWVVFNESNGNWNNNNYTNTNYCRCVR